MKIKRPCFVKAEIKNGIVEATDDEGEIFHMQMDKREAWPIMSRRIRRFEMMDRHEKRSANKEQPRPPKPFGPPKLVA